jgi:asparagine synthase (glutamine-hydrolysing)
VAVVRQTVSSHGCGFTVSFYLERDEAFRMCGIVGLVRLDGGEASVTRVRTMTDAMIHRGPDSDGFHSFGPVAIGMRRLSIIDVAGGDQPLYSEDEAIALVLNGEIYNFRELTSELTRRGHRFRTGSDAEVVVHAYEEWGDRCVDHLRGMFAFAIVDHRDAAGPRVLIARDPLGIKPLYHWSDGETLIFASEVRALLATELVPRVLDPLGLRSFLSYGSVQDPFTLVNGIRSLLPGHLLRWQGGAPEIERYWRLTVESGSGEPSTTEVLPALRNHLRDAVSSQLISEVPLGVFLSGGIDSTAIAALMKEGGTGPVRSFSIVFEEEEFDERRYARIAAEHIGTEHVELDLRGGMVRDLLQDALAAFDQPSVDGLNTYFVSKVVRDAGLTVALSGVGGDELFGGYSGYRSAIMAERWGGRLRKVPKPLRSALASGLARAPREPLRKAGAVLDGGLHPYFTSRMLFLPRQVDRLLALTVDPQNEGTQRFVELAEETAALDPVNRASALELQTYMLSTLLRDTDQMSMAHSLEVRVPLLDQDLTEMVTSIPGSLKLEQNQPKPLLTRPLEDILPQACVHRPKRGFELPLTRWLRGSLLTEMESFFSGAHDDSVFAPEELRRIWREFKAGRVGWSRVWALFVLHSWLARHRIALAA